MASILQITGNNLVSSASNNKYRVNFPFPFTSYNNEVALQSLFIYYSWRNITSTYGNNTVSYIFNGTTRNLTLPDGFYSINDISAYIQLQMYNNNEYTLDSNGNPHYYLSIQSNTTYYAATLTCRPITLPSGGSNPNGITLSGTSPQLVVNNSAFGTLIGFTNASYPTSPSATVYQSNSNQTAQISPTTSININTNCVNNSKINYINPQTVYSFSPSVGYSSQIIIQPTELLFYKVLDQTYGSIEISFTDQQSRDLAILDTNLVANLILRPIKA